MSIRQEIEAREREILSPRAAQAADSRGRERPERRCPLRTEFQRDRDRILHSKAFRRLAHKTQVFIAPELDHYRTRLTHTLEVAQISRTIARALRLNEDLTEAIALGHDLGHTPFGHGGEHALNLAYRRFDPAAHFLHYEQSLRIVEVLEKDGRGLNLTFEVRDGIASHSKGRSNLGNSKLLKTWLGKTLPSTLEGQVVRVADRVAYVNHDLDDALRAGMITLRQVPAQCLRKLGRTHSVRITTMVGDIVATSRDSDVICMSDNMLDATDRLKEFLYEHVYEQDRGSRGEWHKIELTITGLFNLYMQREDLLPPAPVPGRRTTRRREVQEPPTDRARRVTDYIAGMTDRYAMQQYLRHYIPQAWEK